MDTSIHTVAEIAARLGKSRYTIHGVIRHRKLRARFATGPEQDMLVAAGRVSKAQAPNCYVVDDGFLAAYLTACERAKIPDGIFRELHLLRELRTDIERWNQRGGDNRDLVYVFQTLEELQEEFPLGEIDND